MGSTTKGFRYPEVTDRVADGATAIKNLATDVDTYISTPGAYTAFTYASPFVANGGTPGFRMAGDKVQLRGGVRRSDSAALAVSSSITIATLPAGYRPQGGTKLFPAATNTANIPVRVSIDTSGNIIVDTPSTSGVTVVILDGISFDTVTV